VTETPQPPSSGKQRARLLKAFVDAFESSEDLAPVVYEALNERLTDITHAKGFKNDVYNLLEAADARGMMAVLVCKALEARPRNPLLREVAREFGCSEPSAPQPPSPVPPKPSPGPIVDDVWMTRHRLLICVLISIGVVTLEVLNRHVLHLLQLYVEMENAGLTWTLISVVVTFFWRVLRKPGRYWRYCFLAWPLFVAAFVAVDNLLRRGSFDYFNPGEVQWLLPFFYGCSFGALAWTLNTVYSVRATTSLRA
jgi:hypothetical protein